MTNATTHTHTNTTIRSTPLWLATRHAIAWLRAREGLSVVQLARAARVLLLTGMYGAEDGSPLTIHVGPLDRHLFGHESVMVGLGAHGASSRAVRRKFIEGLACVLIERETGQRIGGDGAARLLVAGNAPLPRAPRRSEWAWWDKSIAMAQARMAESERLLAGAA